MNQKGFSIILIAIAVVIVIALAGVIVPKIVIRDASGLIPEEVESAKRDARMLLDNPIERGLMIDMVAVAKEGDMIRVNAYTFGGVKYATVAVTPNKEARVIRRRWFGGVYAPNGAETAICTQEAKLCPDGSSVGRVPPNCEFAVCPADQDKTVGIPTNWQFIDANSFTLSLPPGWEFNKLQGIDSYVGEFVGDDAKLQFDFGWYSSNLAEDNDPNYTVTYETIDGYRAKIVVPKVTGNGITGVYFDNLGGRGAQRTELNLYGENFTSSQQETVLKIFRTLRIVKQTWP